MIARVVPILLFLLLGVLLAVGLTISEHKEDLPSPLIGNSAKTASTASWLVPLMSPTNNVGRTGLITALEMAPIWPPGLLLPRQEP